MKIILFVPFLAFMAGCVSERVNIQDPVSTYQEFLVGEGPQDRTGTGELTPLIPAVNAGLPQLRETTGPDGEKAINLTLDNAVVRAMANSPEIYVLSFDPSISRENISIAVSEFDLTAFGQVGYDKTDALSNDISQADQFHTSTWEAGVKQKGYTGAEWSLSYSLRRGFDESLSRKFTTSYEPVMVFELRQPLLRDAWPEANLAGLSISKLNYRKSLEEFREKAESVSVQVISLYWALHQARRDLEIQEDLLQQTLETLKKVEDRKAIDASMGDIKFAETAVKNREVMLYEARKRIADVTDRLLKLISDSQMSLLDSPEIIPETRPDTSFTELNEEELLNRALKNNPTIQQAKLELEVAGINIEVAKWNKLPRLDIVASTQMQGLSDSRGEAEEIFSDGDYVGYGVGLTFEYPLGNRERNADLRIRKLRQSKARSNLQVVSDQVATLVREKIRSAETAYRDIRIYHEAAAAAEIHLQDLEDLETVRKKLTPEFLLTKIQAQESLASARSGEIKAIVDYNIALTNLAQATGEVLDLRYVKDIAGR
ncbi:MAG: TolC family protein [Nitrospiraceae bacterium]|nr:MAG: TolC family protein [Nitrospiraceae bacterium]